MRRSILLSLVVIGAAVAVVFGGSTFALFNDTATGTATVSAGTVNILMAAEPSDVVDLELSKTTCPEPLGDDESCLFEFTLQNIGTLSSDWAITITLDETYVGADPTADCFSYTLDPTEAVLEAGDEADLDHDAGETAHNVDLTVTLDNGEEACQGASVDIEFEVIATQSATPRD